MLELTFSRAVEADLPYIIGLLSDDVIGLSRERVNCAEGTQYRKSFIDIDTDDNQFLCVVKEEEVIVGTLQITVIPNLSRNGSKRGQIEAVRVASDRRGKKIGEAMLQWAIEYCRERGCSIVQLTTDKRRNSAHRFYERLGFDATHVGYKLFI